VELVAFESSNGMQLPEDYRLFLATVGNGGAGPFYGLEPLGSFGRDLSKPPDVCGDLSAHSVGAGAEPLGQRTSEPTSIFGDSFWDARNRTDTPTAKHERQQP